MIRRPPRSTPKPSSAASDVYKRQVVEVNLVMKRYHVNVKERNKDMYAAIDKAFDVVKKQVVRHEEKLKSHRIKKEEGIGG